MKHIPALVSMKFAIWFCTALILFQSGCKDNPVDAPIKNPREYTWTIDTIAYPGSNQTIMFSLWGSSLKDVYAAGHNASAYGKAYHYDGSSWQPVSAEFKILALSSVLGFGASDVWMVGHKDGYPDPSLLGVVIHYDGMKWNEFSAGKPSALECIWGSSSSDVWIGGQEGTLLHYDGRSITPDSAMMKIAKSIDATSQFLSGASVSADETYALLLAATPGAIGYRCHILKRQNNTWSQIDTTFGSSVSCLWCSPSGKLYRGTNGVEVLQDGKWNRVFSGRSIYRISGIGDDNFFAVGASIYHWNGKDAHEFKELPADGLALSDVWTDGKEVFVIGNIYTQTIVFHGR